MDEIYSTFIVCNVTYFQGKGDIWYVGQFMVDFGLKLVENDVILLLNVVYFPNKLYNTMYFFKKIYVYGDWMSVPVALRCQSKICLKRTF